MPDLGREFRVPKTSEMHGDVFAAVGLADILCDVLASDEAVKIVDEGATFRIVANRGITTEEVVAAGFGAGYAFLKTSAKAAPKGCADVLDYPVQKRRFDTWRIEREKLKKLGKNDADIADTLRDLQPADDWRHWQVINSLQGDGATNAMVMATLRKDFRVEVAAALAEVVSGRPSAAPWEVSLVQVFSPLVGKGFSRLKPDSTSRTALPDHWCDPFWEWCRHRGYFRVGAPYFTGKGGKDVRLYAIVPADISVAHLRLVSQRFRAEHFGGASKFKGDVLAVLAAARILVEHSQFGGGPIPIRRKRINRVISGLTVAHYQSLGQGRALAETGGLGLPGWIDISSATDAEDFLQALAEHRLVIRQLHDDHSDEIDLLGRYRRFLQTRSDECGGAFLDFASAYGNFVLRARGAERERSVPQLSIENTERILMSIAPKYSSALQDPGLRAVADAIRNATVAAQYWKSKKKEHREIRYALLPDLRRKRGLPGSEFVEAVADFVATYNAENSRRREMGKPAPANIAEEQFLSLATLIEAQGAPLIGSLLCALGTCKQQKEGEE